MIKLIYCLRRLPQLTLPQFQEHWRSHHYQYGARMDGIRRYIQYHTDSTLEASDLVGDAYDGVMNSWWDSAESMKRIFATSPEMAAALADERYFIDHRRSVAFPAEEVVVQEPRRPAPIVVFEFLQTNSTVDAVRAGSFDLAAHSAELESAVLAGHLLSVRCASADVQVGEMEDLTSESNERPWDLVSALYFQSSAHAAAYFASAANKQREALQAEFVSETPYLRVLTRRCVFADLVR